MDNDTMDLTATITGTGADSAAPDTPGAVDALIAIDGKWAFDVTLIPDHTGKLSVWGQLDHWCSRGDLFEAHAEVWDEAGLDLQDDVEAAVREAVRQDA